MNQPAVIIHILLIFLLNQPASLQASPEIITNEAVMNFPESIVFRLEIESEVVIDKVTLVYSSDGRSCQSGDARKDIDLVPGKALELDWEWDFIRNGTIPPGVEVEWQWEITDSWGNVTMTEPEKLQIQDQRYDWQQFSDDGITLQWFEGGESFGKDLHRIALDSRELVSGFLGIEFDEEVWITVYPYPEDVGEAVKFIGDRVGGVAFPDHNAMIITAHAGQEDWSRQVIPHEFAHLLLEAYTFNCLGNWMPTWFEEGMAEYAEGGLDEHDIKLIQSANEEGNLPTLRSLVSSFSYDEDDIYIHYQVSNAVIDYLIEQYGSQKMAELLDQLGAGKMIDPALEMVYGIDTDGLDAAWRVSIGFASLDELTAAETTPPTITPIPILALYTSVVQPSATAAATPTPTDSPQVTESIPLSPTSTDRPAVLLDENPTPGTDNPKTNFIWIVPGIVLITGLIAAVFVYIQRRV
jgi:hypothetical protein